MKFSTLKTIGQIACHGTVGRVQKGTFAPYLL